MQILKILCFLLGFLLCGCTSTITEVLEFDTNGKLVKHTKTSESVIRTITDSTKGKTVIAWDRSQLTGIVVSTATTEDPTPTFKALYGRNDKGAINILPNSNLETVPEVIKAIRSGEVSVSTEGISDKTK